MQITNSGRPTTSGRPLLTTVSNRGNTGLTANTRQSHRTKRTWAAYAALQKDRLAVLKDAPPWLVSLIFHLILMLMLALSTFTSSVGQGLLLTLSQGESGTALAVAEFSLEPFQIDASSVAVPALSDISWQPSVLDVPLEMTGLTPNMAAATPAAAREAVRQAVLAGASSTLPSMFGGRSGAIKQALLKSGGGTAETEAAVALGLEWLKRQQQRDGTWSMRGPYANGGGAENKTSATAMALLAFMGAGHTHQAGQYKAEVLKGVKWLAAQQNRQGFMALEARDNEKMYAQAQATIALCELYGMTHDYWLRPFAQRACDFACESQSPAGGWRYVPRFDADTSVTGWFVMGLKSGQAAGLEISTRVFPKVNDYLDSVGSDYNAGYAYQVGRRASPSMTAEGILCRQYLGWHRHMPGMAQGLGSLVANHPLNPRQSDVYYWYYATQALHHYGGPLWEEWNDTLRVELPASQIDQGAERGSWSPHRDAWGSTAGRLYTTCLSLYCLEVYYRHMPLYDPDTTVTQ